MEPLAIPISSVDLFTVSVSVQRVRVPLTDGALTEEQLESQQFATPGGLETFVQNIPILPTGFETKSHAWNKGSHSFGSVLPTQPAPVPIPTTTPAQFFNSKPQQQQQNKSSFDSYNNVWALNTPLLDSLLSMFEGSNQQSSSNNFMSTFGDMNNFDKTLFWQMMSSFLTTPSPTSNNQPSTSFQSDASQSNTIQQQPQQLPHVPMAAETLSTHTSVEPVPMQSLNIKQAQPILSEVSTIESFKRLNNLGAQSQAIGQQQIVKPSIWNSAHTQIQGRSQVQTVSSNDVPTQSHLQTVIASDVPVVNGPPVIPTMPTIATEIRASPSSVSSQASMDLNKHVQATATQSSLSHVNIQNSLNRNRNVQAHAIQESLSLVNSQDMLNRNRNAQATATQPSPMHANTQDSSNRNRNAQATATQPSISHINNKDSFNRNRNLQSPTMIHTSPPLVNRQNSLNRNGNAPIPETTSVNIQSDSNMKARPIDWIRAPVQTPTHTDWVARTESQHKLVGSEFKGNGRPNANRQQDTQLIGAVNEIRNHMNMLPMNKGQRNPSTSTVDQRSSASPSRHTSSIVGGKHELSIIQKFPLFRNVKVVRVCSLVFCQSECACSYQTVNMVVFFTKKI